jgi:hypothetical protein
MKTIYSLIIALMILTGSYKSGLTQATLTLPLDVPGTPGNTVTIPVNAKGISNLVGFQFTIEYDKDKLTYLNISNWATGITGVTVSTPQEGKITFVYADPNVKINIADGKFFDVNFTVKDGTAGSAGLAWSGNPTAKSLINYDLEEISCNYVNGSVKIQSTCVAPVSPTSISASQTTIAAGTSVTLQVNGGNLNSAPNWVWYTGNCGGTQVGTGATLSVSPASTTTYYVQASECGTSTTCRSVTINVNPAACANTNTALVIGQNYPNEAMQVTSVTLSPAIPEPGETVTVNVSWKANSCGSCIVKANVFGSWSTSDQLMFFHNGFNETKSTTFTFTAPSTAGRHYLRLIWAFDIGDFSNYTGSNLPSGSQCSNWGNSICFITEKSFEINDTILQIENNIALSSLGATAEDNGSFNDYEFDQDAVLTIDNDNTSYWAGLQSSSPQQMWINFDKTYVIDKIYIDEREDGYMNTGKVEYFDGTVWKLLVSIDKTAPDLIQSFTPVTASKIRITVNSVTANPAWYNKVACFNSVEVNGSVPICSNTNIVLTEVQSYPNEAMQVTSVTLTPSSPKPGEIVTVNVSWKANSCGSCIVKANVFGSWGTSSQLTSFHDGFNETKSTTFTFTAPSSAGTHSLRLIWAFDIGDFSNYTGSNLPSSSQCSSWGNSVCFVTEKSFEINETILPIENNIALSSLGATAEDNGSFNDYEFDQDALLTIDNDNTSYWAGLQSSSPQQMWINFDKTYIVDKIYIDEREDGYMNTGKVEYFDGTVWKLLVSIDKTAPDLIQSFTPVTASKIRITVNSVTANPAWYNKVACFNSVEVNGSVPICSNTNIVLTEAQSYPNEAMQVTSVTLTPSSPKPGEIVTVNVSWKANSCGSCIVKANVFGSWSTSSQLTSFHDGWNETKSASFTFTAPNTNGNHNLRFIWAFDIGSFSNYTGSNMPSSSQCSSWGNSICFVAEKNFQINSSCITPSIPVVGSITQPSCSVSTGSVVLNGLPASGNWTITRTPGSTTTTGTGTTKTITGLTAGTHTFTVTNAEGCVSASANAVINQPSLPNAPVIGTISINSVVLNGLPSSGNWTITRTPGNITYSGSGTSYTITPLNPGSHTFTVTNSSGCTSSASSPAFISGTQSATLTIGNAVISSGGNVSVPVNAKQITDMVGFQFTIEYDKNKLNYINTSDWASGITGVVVSNPQEGKITFVYADPNLKINISDNKFFNINFTMKDGASGSANIVWSDNPTVKSLVNYDLEEISCTYESIATSFKSITEPHFQIYPNPFGNFIRIENHEKVTRLKITNVLGQAVIDSEYPQHLTNTEKLTDGVYFITLFGEDDVLKSVKMIKNSR